MKKILYYIFWFFVILVFSIILFIFLNHKRINSVIERQGLAHIDSGYRHPEVVNNFITEEQNKYILEYASSRFYPSAVGGGLVNSVNDNIRKSQTAWVPKDDPVIKPIYMKLCSQYSQIFENAEDMQVVKYERDNYYREHHDSFPYYEPDFLSLGGHRILTALIYLNNDFEAGETRFPNLDKSFKPNRNSAIVFFPLDAEGKKCHPLALHAGLPIKSGIKYVCNIWIREEPYKYEVDTWSYNFLLDSTILYFYKKYLGV